MLHLDRLFNMSNRWNFVVDIYMLFTVELMDDWGSFYKIL